MAESKITELFAKELLRALYKLDRPIGRMDVLIPTLKSLEQKHELQAAIGDLMLVVLSELMLPLYNAHPQLGSVSQPGTWLNE